MNIRTRLRALILVTLLPVAILGVAGGYLLVERERETFERGVRDRVRVLMSAIDAELRAVITPVELLARSRSLESADLVSFRAEAERALEARRGDWGNILVSDAQTGELLLNALVPPGAPLAKRQIPKRFSNRAAAPAGGEPGGHRAGVEPAAVRGARTGDERR